MLDVDRFNPLSELNSLNSSEFWRSFQGKLPCIEYSAACVEKIQSMAVAASPLLASIDVKLQEMQEAIDNAVVANGESQKMAILKPALLYFATPETVSIVENGKTRSEQRGIINRIVDVVISPGKIVNELVGAVAKPVADALTGGSSEVRQSNIAIASLNGQISDLRVSRQKLELEVRTLVDERLAAVDAAVRHYKIVMNELAVDQRRLELYRLSFIRGFGTLSEMLAIENAVNSQASRAIAAFTSMRTEVNRLKLIAYGGLEIEE